MRRCLSTFAALISIAASSPTATAQRLPSRGTDFEQLLAMTRAAADAKQTERAARLAFLARSRILVRPNSKGQEGMLRIFDDVETDAVARAKRYVEVLGPVKKVLAIEKLDAALAKIADPLKAQVEGLITDKYKTCAAFVIEPLWAFDVEWTLDAVERIHAIPDAGVPEEDKSNNTGLRMSDWSARDSDGAISMTLGDPSPRAKTIAGLRRDSGHALVDVAKSLVDADLDWFAWDLEFIGPQIFALSPRAFWPATDLAMPQLTKPRLALSKSVIAQYFKSPKKGLVNKAWKVGAEDITFPPNKVKKPGLLVTGAPLKTDFRFAGTFGTDLALAPVGIVFAYKSDDDYCVAMISSADGGHPHVEVDHVVKGKPTELGKWQAEEKLQTDDPLVTWPIAFERHGSVVWLLFVDFGWQVFDTKLDLTGNFGFYLPAEAQPARESINVVSLDLEPLPEAPRH